MIGRLVREVTRIERRLLQRVYGFDAWHVGHAGEPYGRDIVRALNARPSASRGSAVEIGCGLGDILRRLTFARRLGLDRDRAALEAARFLATLQWSRDLRFAPFEFPSDHLDGRWDAIVMVNWIHAVEPARLTDAVAGYFERHLEPGGWLVLDTVPDPAYTYNHDVHALAPPASAINRLGTYSRGREVWALSKPS
jgi:SAM-dependent methyltransferase